MKKRSIHTMALYREDRLSAVPLMTLNNRQDAPDSPNSEKDWSDQELEEFSRDPLEGVLMQMRLWPQTITRQQCIRSVLFVSSICLCTGFLIAYVLFFLLYPPLKPCPLMENGDTKISSRIISEIQADQIQTFIRELNLKPESENEDSSFYVLKQLNNSGLDEVKSVPYKIRISHQVRVIRDGEIIFRAITINNILPDGKNENSQVHSHFSEDLDINAKDEVIIYVNYGQPEDYDFLLRDQITINGSVVLIKSRKMLEMNAISLAKQQGASAIILYFDPFDVSYDESILYPNSVSMPESEKKGGISRKKREDEPHHVPVLYISCDEAKKLLKMLGGRELPSNWEDSFKIQHKIGPGLLDSQKLQIIHKKQTLQLNNVLGILHGSRETDRYILVGSSQKHLKTSSRSISVLLELARVFGKLKNNGWRPLRSIMFCIWEEPYPGLTGSIKWIEEFSKILSNRAVVYLNVEFIASGNNSLKIHSSPLLWNSLEEAAKKVLNPYNKKNLHSNATLYDVWMKNATKDSEGKDSRLEWALPSATLDSYVPFFHQLGISTLGINFDASKHADSSTVSPVTPSTHEIDETPSLENLQFHVAITQLLGEVTRILGDSLILPFDTRDYARFISRAFAPLESENDLVKNFEATFSELKSVINNFTATNTKFQDELNKADRSNPFAIRIINDQLIQLERAFIRTNGLSCNPSNKHALVSPVSSSDSILSYLMDLLKGSEVISNEHTQGKIKQDFMNLIFYLQSAINVLKLNL